MWFYEKIKQTAFELPKFYFHNKKIRVETKENCQRNQLLFIIGKLKDHLEEPKVSNKNLKPKLSNLEQKPGSAENDLNHFSSTIAGKPDDKTNKL